MLEPAHGSGLLRAVVAFALTATGSLSCGKPAPAESAESAESLKGEVGTSAAPQLLSPTWGRCAEVRGTNYPLCLFDPEQPLKLWLTHERAGEAEILVDGAEIRSTSHTVVDMTGQGGSVILPPSATVLSIRVPGAEPWSLRLRSIHSPDDPEVVRALDEVKRHFDRSRRIYKDRGDWNEARREAEHAFTIARDVGLTSWALDSALMSTFYLSWQLERVDLAVDTLDLARELAEGWPLGRADWYATLGHVRYGEGFIEPAARAYREASRIGLALADRRLVVEALPMYASALADLGYVQAAAQWAAHAIALVEQGSVAHAQVLETAAWVNLVLWRDGHPHADPIPLYLRAVEILEPGGSAPEPDQVGPAYLGLAEAYLLAGSVDVALRWIGRVDRERLILDDRAYLHDLELRAWLRRGEPGPVLRAGLAEFEQAVERAVTPDARWRLATRRGDLYAIARHWERAEVAYHEAEEQLDALVRLAAVGVGRVAVGETRRASAIKRANALIELGRPAEALCALRRAQARWTQIVSPDQMEPQLRQRVASYLRRRAGLEDLSLEAVGLPLDERATTLASAERQAEVLRGELDEILYALAERWPHPTCEQLHQRRSDELLLGLYPAGNHWLVLAQDDEGTTATRLEGAAVPTTDTQRRSLSRALLRPLEARIEGKRLRVLAMGEARRVDVHTLPWNDGPLLRSVTVTYGTEVVPAPERPWPEQPVAVLAADPTYSLPGAEQEVEHGLAELRRAGYSADAIPQPLATPSEVARRLQHSDLFHFSGHSAYPGVEEHGMWPPYTGGTPGTAAHLVLVGKERLTANEISLLSTVPEVVILDGCEAGTHDPAVGGASLAGAFVAAGSRVVVASPDMLRDEAAAQLGAALYAELDGAERFDAAKALRLAQSRLWDDASAPEQTLGRYRAWVP